MKHEIKLNVENFTTATSSGHISYHQMPGSVFLVARRLSCLIRSEYFVELSIDHLGLGAAARQVWRRIWSV